MPLRHRLCRWMNLLLMSAVAGGCAQKVESPSVELDAVGPNLVCNAQRAQADVSIQLNGSGFTPMPTNVLAEPAILVLPEVMLSRTQDLDGSEANGAEVVFPGAPGETLSNNLVWTSATEMSIRISEADPAVELEVGLYDVIVTNPDGVQTFVEEAGLAVIPPPAIDSIEPVPPAVCTAQGSRQVIISGHNFLVDGGAKPLVTLSVDDTDVVLDPEALELSDCRSVSGSYSRGRVQLCDTITATLGASVAPGAYRVTVSSPMETPATAQCASREEPLLLIVPPPTVTDVVPPAICVDQSDQVVTIHGGNFARIQVGEHAGAIPTVTLAGSGGSSTYEPTLSDCAVPEGADMAFGVELCDSLEITIPAGDLEPGDHELVITNPDPIGCESEEILTLQVNAPPRVDSINPQTVCSGGSVIAVSGSGFIEGATAELRCGSGSTFVASGVTVIDANNAQLTFPGGVTAGESCEVVFINADGCEDRPLPHRAVTGTEGPILYNVDPHVAYNGIDTMVQLYVTALEAPFSVRMWPDGGDPADGMTLDSTLAPNQTTVLQANIPAGTAAGAYTLAVNDNSGCLASLSTAVTVTDNLDISSGTVTPSFGQTSSSVAITIILDSAGSAGLPRGFLNPSTPGTPAIALQGVAPVGTAGTTFTAIVPAGTPADVYDLVLVWEDGTVAVLSNAYTSVQDPPPVVDDVTPQSIINTTGQDVTAVGTGFNDASMELFCEQPNGAAVQPSVGTATEDCTDPTACTLTATVDATGLAEGSVCVVRVLNPDGAYGEFSALGVTGPSLNLTQGQPGTELNIPRRALSSLAVQATSAARFVYAIGGDGGPSASDAPFDSVEVAAVDVFGAMGSWDVNRQSLNTARAKAGEARIGRYMYIFGGTDGTDALASGERALVLSPEEVPEISAVDLCLAGGSGDCFGVEGLGEGLEEGTYAYRISAVIDDADPVNLGGETLASDPFVLRLRTVQGRRVTVQIDWSAPVDNQGAELSGLIGYRIYRTPADGMPGTDEVLLAELPADQLSFIDDGSEMLGTDSPLPLGSTSLWQPLPDMQIARNAPRGVAAVDPDDPTLWHVYALLGKDSGSDSDASGTALASYEFLDITTLPNGRQTVAAQWSVGDTDFGTGRWHHGAWVADNSLASVIPVGETWVYVGGGRNGSGPANVQGSTDAAQVTAGGQLAGFASASANHPSRTGFGTAAGSGRLFQFGGTVGGSVMDDGQSFGLVSSNQLAPAADNEGGLSIGGPRNLMGSSLQSALIFLVGGYSGTTVVGTTAVIVQ